MTLIKLFFWGLLIYLAYVSLLFALQRHILFPRYQIHTPATSPESSPPFDRIWLRTGFGKVEAWFLPASRTGKTRTGPALIFAHGNAELIDHWVDEFAGFASSGLAVLLVEYPGYGRSQGHPSQKTIRITFETAYDLLAKRPDVDPSRIVLMGRSLGGGAACELAKTRPGAALVLVSTFTSVRRLAKRFLVPTPLIRDRFENLSVVRSFPGPVLVVHGRDDTLIPLDHGLTLFRGASQGHMITYRCGHNDCPPDWERFRRDVISFLVEADLMEKPEDFGLQPPRSGI